jgi:hypothetical protein
MTASFWPGPDRHLGSAVSKPREAGADAGETYDSLERTGSQFYISRILLPSKQETRRAQMEDNLFMNGLRSCGVASSNGMIFSQCGIHLSWP